ncbi:DNA polymerase III subunit delta [Jiulongibacter sediminis]|jgi:DNA polymerase-3 subunit delta'|uniref:DNA polymerase III subunit n=1 Tax=Jiulongibacter sediminis TaxID=1605367 RepID=UPI0026F18F82|nr:DNA polymerase III subunit delta [Jiulongibacter sediminis]
MRFSDIKGLDEQKRTLIQSVQKNHVAHAQLFHGSEGSANLALALAFGSYLNCENPTNTDSCGQCSSCLKTDKLIHPDVSFIFPTAGGKKVLSENFMAEWREFVLDHPYKDITEWLEKIGIKQGNIPVEEARKLIGNLSLKSYEGGYKLIYVWLPEYLSIATANAILKILEEPPEQTIFMLVCNDAQNLLTTIISRTQRFAVPKFREEDIVPYLVEKGTTTERSKEIARLSEGNLLKAYQIANAKNDNMHDWFANWMRYCYAFNVLELVPMADDFDALSKEQEKQILEYGLTVFREIFLMASGNENMVKLEEKPLDFVKNFSKVFNINNLSKISELVDEAIFHIDRNVRAKIVFLDLSLQMARLIK